jgi:glutamyl/glutaminyl-tRNA synthetase
MAPLDLAALRGRLPPGHITRFAPSPTGFLHLGHVANVIYVWGVARALGGQVLLRVEDHDRWTSRRATCRRCSGRHHCHPERSEGGMT